MKQKTCEICGHSVEGFSEKDLSYRMVMHKMKHRVKQEEEELSDELHED